MGLDVITRNILPKDLVRLIPKPLMFMETESERDMCCSISFPFAFDESIVFLPCKDSGFECIIGRTGRDDVLFILDVNSFVNENDLGAEHLSSNPGVEAPTAMMAALSSSEVELRYLKLNRGRRLLLDDTPLEEDGTDDPSILVEAGLIGGREHTPVAMGLVGDMSII